LEYFPIGVLIISIIVIFVQTKTEAMLPYNFAVTVLWDSVHVMTFSETKRKNKQRNSEEYPFVPLDWESFYQICERASFERFSRKNTRKFVAKVVSATVMSFCGILAEFLVEKSEFIGVFRFMVMLLLVAVIIVVDKLVSDLEWEKKYFVLQVKDKILDATKKEEQEQNGKFIILRPDLEKTEKKIQKKKEKK